MDRRTFLKTSTAFSVASAASLGHSTLVFANPGSLSWISPSRINPAHSYVLAAVEKGWFKELGINVEIRVGTGTAQSVTQVASSNSTFGQAASLTSCPAIADQGADMMTVGQVQYRGFFELASLKSKPLRSPADWQGKTIGVMSLGGTTDVLLNAMTLNAGMNPESVKKVVTGVSASGVTFLQRGDVDAFFVFPDSKIALQKMGVDLSYLPTDEFAPFPGDAIIVSRKNAASPEYRDPLVKFLKGCRRGLDYMQEPKNFRELIGYVAKYNPIEGGDVDKGSAVLSLMRAYYAPTGGTPRPVCDEKAWQAGVQLMEKMGLIKKRGLPLTAYVDNSFAKQAVA